MFGPLGFQEILIILGLALLIFGPRELPKIGRTIGRALGEFRKASTELKRSLNTEMIQEELRQSDPRKLVRDTARELEAAAMAEDPEAADSEHPEAAESEHPEAAQEPAAGGSPAASVPRSRSPADDEAPEAPASVPRDRPATAAGS